MRGVCVRAWCMRACVVCVAAAPNVCISEDTLAGPDLIYVPTAM
jgi:hypothetical protein